MTFAPNLPCPKAPVYSTFLFFFLFFFAFFLLLILSSLLLPHALFSYYLVQSSRYSFSALFLSFFPFPNIMVQILDVLIIPFSV